MPSYYSVHESDPTTPTRIAHVITGLETGGAETMLYRLIAASDRQHYDHHVLSLTNSAGNLKSKIMALGVPVVELGMAPGRPTPLGLWRLMRHLRRIRPNLVHNWMYHANLAGGLAAKLTGIGPIIWGIHASSLEKETTKTSTRLVVWLSSLLSGWMPEEIICCSQSSLQIHLSFGYQEEKLSVIPNGFDIDAFAPNPQVRREVRAELGIPDGVPVIGQVARFDPQKDFPNFIAAVQQLLQHRPDAHVILCGNGIDRDNHRLMTWIEDAGIGHAVHLLGERDDVPRICTAFDVATMSSAYGEAFPLAVGEAMASGVPAVVTNVGDSAYLVGDTGKVVAPRNPGALCRAWEELLSMPPEQRKALGAAARDRIVTHFSIDTITRRFEDLYDALRR